MNLRAAIIAAAVLLAIGCTTPPVIAPAVNPAPVTKPVMLGIQYYIVEDGTGKVLKNGFIVCDNLLDGLEAVNVYIDDYKGRGFEVWPYIIIVDRKEVAT